MGWCGLAAKTNGRGTEIKPARHFAARAVTSSDLRKVRTWGHAAAPNRPVLRPYSAIPSARTQQIWARELLRGRVARGGRGNTSDRGTKNKETGTTIDISLAVATRLQRPQTANPVVRAVRRRPLAVLQQHSLRERDSAPTKSNPAAVHDRRNKDKSSTVGRFVRRPRPHSRSQSRTRSQGRSRGSRTARIRNTRAKENVVV